MSEPDLESKIDAARAYESLFVPALFGQWCSIMADAAQLRAGQSVLDVACGTGALTSEGASRVGTSGHVVGLDLNPGMLVVANERSPGIDWYKGAAEKLPFREESFDAVLCQFGLMFFSDRNQAINEMLRVLKPSGHLLIAVWDSIENIPGYLTEMKLIERSGGEAAARAVRAPFVLGRRDDLRKMVQDAVALSATVTTHKGKARFPSVQTMVEAELRGWLPVMGVDLCEEKINTILTEAERALAPFTTANGEVVFDITSHVICVQKP